MEGTEEVSQDGYLEVTFLDHDNIKFRYTFAEISGWRTENGWLKVFFFTHHKAWPFHRIESVDVVYNSPEVQARMLEYWRPYDVCKKCGGEIEVRPT